MNFLNFLAKKNSLIVLAVVNVILICVFGYLKGHLSILDSKFFYLKSEIQPLFALLGEEGRYTYHMINLVDFGFIAAYTLFFLGVYTAFFKDLAKILIIIPILLFLADVLETSIIFYLLKIYPESNNGLEYVLMFATPAKWMLALSSLLIIVNGYLVNFYMKKT